MNTVIKRAWNKNKLVKVEDLTGMTFQAESGGHTFEISGVDDTGAAVSLSGTVDGRFLRADNAEIIISGTASGGKVSVTLSEACYAIPGRFLLTIYVTSGGQKVAVYAATGSVVATSGTASGSIPPLVTDSVQANTGTFGSISTGNATVDGVLDVTQRRCYANLSSAGWYRVMNVTGGFGGGARSFAVDINITRSYDGTNNEVHCVKLLCVYNGNSIFTNEVSKSNALIIDKIRYNNDSGGNGFLDIHYAGSVTNETSVDFTVHVNPQSQHRFTAIPLDRVADSPSGETVLRTYEFAANTRELLTTNIIRIRRTYSNITISSNNGYVLLDSFENMGVSSQNYFLGFNIVGWSGFPTFGFQIMRGSNGTDFYLASSVAGTFYSFTVEYWFADLSV